MDATIVVQFGDSVSSDAHVVVELDDAHNLEANGDVKTTFYPEDEVHFRVHVRNASVSKITKTSGSITSQGSFIYSVSDNSIQFEDIDVEQELGYYPSGGVGFTWYGNQGDIQRSGRNLVNKFNGPCIGTVSYSYSAFWYKFTPPSLDLGEEDIWPVLIVVHVE